MGFELGEEINFSSCTQEEFTQLLGEILDEKPASFLLSIPGAYEVFSEYFNNDVLLKWATSLKGENP